ncbi:MAG: outer membrane lipoprotein carrier protein LolA, partial [Candidatus Eisenbacteria bacterium]|nr:outer membrane lipoprotein carrier protein LolA [Candidatus Eisenbacteria bacterium]
MLAILVLFASVSGRVRSQDAPPAQAPPTDGEVALRQIAAPFAALRTFQAKFVQTQSWVGMDEVAEYRGVLSISRPNRFRIEYSEPKGHLQVSDGTQVWTYVPGN